MSGTIARISPPEPHSVSVGPSSRSRLPILLCTAVLLIVSLELSLHADSLSVWSDEMWSIFHSSKSVAQILREPDLVWPFGYYLALHGWMRLTGSTNDFVMHVLGVFLAVLNAACLIRIGREWRVPLAGLLAAFAFGTSSFGLYFSLELRGYALMLLLESSFILAYLRWVKRPSLPRSFLLLAVMIAMAYTHFLLLLVMAIATIHRIFSQPKLLMRWFALLGLTCAASLPLLPQLVRGVQAWSALAQSGPSPAYARLGLDSLYHTLSSHWDIWFAVVLACSAVGMVWVARRLQWSTLIWLMAWALAFPLTAYALRNRLPLFTTRHLSLIMPAAFLLLGAGLAALPKPWLGAGALAVLALAPWQPFDFRPSYADAPPVRDFMREMAQAYRPGDRLVVDPQLAPLASSLEWGYYKSIYLPKSDLRLDEQGTPVERRVWYLYRQGKEDPDVEGSVRLGRVQLMSWGPWYLHASLFEAPPSDIGTPFGRALRFLGADVDRLTEVHVGDTLPIRLWWVADLPTSTDFTVDLEMCDSGGRILAHTVGSPVGQAGTLAPGTLRPGEILVDTRSLQVPYRLADGFYSLQITVMPGGDNSPPAGGESSSPWRMVIDRFHVFSYAAW